MVLVWGCGVLWRVACRDTEAANVPAMGSGRASVERLHQGQEGRVLGERLGCFCGEDSLLERDPARVSVSLPGTQCLGGESWRVVADEEALCVRRAEDVSTHRVDRLLGQRGSEEDVAVGLREVAKGRGLMARRSGVDEGLSGVHGSWRS